MTIKSGFYESADGSKVEAEILISILKQFRDKGLNTPSLGEEIKVEGMTAGQRESAIKNLESEGMLMTEGVQRGYFHVMAYRLSHKAERVLMEADGIDPKEADKQAILSILNKANDAGKPIDPELENVQSERLRYLVSNLIQEGMIEEAFVQRGFFSVSGVKITEHGKESLARLNTGEKVVARPESLNIS